MQEQNKAIVRRFVEEVVNGGNLADIDRLVGADFLGHLSLRDVQGPDSVRQMVAASRAAFPDLRATVNDQASEDGGVVVTRVTVEGTHQDSFAGIAPTGRRVSVTAIATTHFREDKIVEAWCNLNELLMMQQLGVIPTY